MMQKQALYLIYGTNRKQLVNYVHKDMNINTSTNCEQVTTSSSGGNTL